MAQLYQLVGPRSYLSDSIKASYEAAKAGQTLPEIAQHRKLKLGTVQEHLLTAAIWLPFAEFPYDSYLTPAVTDYLAQHLTDADIDQWRFNMVRTSDDITEFFLFRLYEIWQTKQEQAHEQA
nr:helix-turn-helix domain-containing protein [Weissella uvarum]